MGNNLAIDLVVLAALLGGIAYFAFFLAMPEGKFAEKKVPQIKGYVDAFAVPEGAEPFMKALEIKLDEFFRKSERSFSSCSMDLYEGMRADAAAVEKNAYEIIERLPNDAYADRDAREAVRNIQKILDAHVEDMRRRCALPVVKRGGGGYLDAANT
jgi:hypothetical protein